MPVGEDLDKALNRLAGTTGLAATKAANVWAGTTNLELIGALNVKAGNTPGVNSKEFFGVCHQLAGALSGSTILSGMGAIASCP